ncbi:MAG: ATP synthase F1 subunit delta [Bacteroidetes bacterium]|nr:ATP synthase F1 subunit delta [Bacteroidota bacterium]
MKNTKIGSRYAKALLDIALEQDFLEKAREDMETIAQVVASSKEFRLLMGNPVVNAAKKTAVLKEIFGKYIHPGTLMFLTILTQKRREIHLGTIAAEFIRLYNEVKNIKIAYLKTAIAADEATRTKVTTIVKDRFHCNVQLVEEVDPKLIGGFVLKIGDYQYDASIASELIELRKQFQTNVYKKGF